MNFCSESKSTVRIMTAFWWGKEGLQQRGMESTACSTEDWEVRQPIQRNARSGMQHRGMGSEACGREEWKPVVRRRCELLADMAGKAMYSQNIMSPSVEVAFLG